jgi:hypothetical protein
MAVRELVLVLVYGVSLCEGRRDGGLLPESLTTDIFEPWIYVKTRGHGVWCEILGSAPVGV